VEREDSESTASEPDANLALVQRQASKLAEEPSASEPDPNLELASETQQDAQGWRYAKVTDVVQEGCSIFSSSHKGPKIVLTNGGATATSSNLGHSWNTVYSADSVSSGYYAWDVTIDALADHSGNYWELVIGVAADTKATSNWLSRYETGYGYIQQIGDKTVPRRRGDHASYAPTYTQGDKITVELNVSSLTLSFKKNGVSSGMAYRRRDMVAGTYRLAVSIGDSGDRVSVGCAAPQPLVHGLWSVTRKHTRSGKTKSEKVCGFKTDILSIGSANSKFCTQKQKGDGQVLVNQDGIERSWAWFCTEQGETTIVGSPTFAAEEADGPCSNQHNALDDGQ
jgi:hypothetical protein